MPGLHDTQFSVVIACLNAEEHIAEALDSVLAQEHPSYEVIVVDGGSTDSTPGLLAEYERRFEGRLQWISEVDRGLYDAMNKGLSRACGRWVVFLGADDRMASGALSIVARLAASDAPQIICGSTRVFWTGGALVEPARSFRTRPIPKRAPARHQSIYVSRDALLAIGGFDTSYRIAADYDAYLRLLRSGAEESLLADVLSEFRLGGVSSTRKIRTVAEYRDIRIAHGANPGVEYLVMFKSLVAAWVTGALRNAGLIGRRSK